MMKRYQAAVYIRIAGRFSCGTALAESLDKPYLWASGITDGKAYFSLLCPYGHLGSNGCQSLKIHTLRRVEVKPQQPPGRDLVLEPMVLKA